MAETADDSQLPADVFRDAFNASPVGIVLEDLDGRPLFVNRAFCSMFGLTEGEALDKHCVDFSPAEDAAKDWALFAQLRTGSIDHYHLDKHYLRRDGSLFWGRVSLSLVNDRPSPLVIGIVEDITERMIALQTLELATEEVIGVTRCSRDFRYRWVSPGYAKWLQRPAADIVGHHLEELLGEQTFSAIKPYLDRVSAGETVTYEMEIELPIGRRWRSARYTPSLDASGAPDGWVAVIVDITDRVRAEQERSRNAAIVESTDDGVLSMDRDGIILSWNDGARRLFGYTESEAVGRPVTMLVPDELRDREHDNICERVRRGEHVERLETERITKDGKRIDVSLTISPIRDERGEIVGSCDIARDVSERKQFEKSLLWHMDFERLLSDLSRTFISLPDDQIDANVERALAQIGAFLGIDRITVYGLSSEQTSLTVNYLWSVPGVALPPMSIRPTELPYWSDKVLRGEVAVVSRLEDLPATAEREFLRRWGTVSAASIPLNVGGEITGAITFVTLRREVSWTDALVRQLRAISDILSNALERKQAMAALRASQAVTQESEERFRLVANTAPAMIWTSGIEGSCDYFNQSWLAFTGRTLEDEIGHGWADGVHAEDRSRCWRTYIEAFEERRPFHMEYRLRRHDGRYRWILDNGAPRFNLDGSFAGYIGSCVDITERREVDAIRSAFSRRLIRAQEAERAAVGRELHDDINQRVALAMLNLESLKSNLHRITDVKQELGTVIEQLDEISVDIQALSHRLHSSKLEQLGLRAAAEGFCREVATMHKVDVDFRSDDFPKDLRSEISLCLFRILQEAVQNATKHSGTTHLQVSLTGSPEEIVLTVSDAGVGFDAGRAAKGRGIGLASMRERLRLVRGQLSIESRPGQGTVMRARVPLGPRARPAQQV